MQRDYLPALKLGHRGEHRLKHSPNSVSQPRDEVVQHKFREVGRWPGMTLQLSNVSDWFEPMAV